MAVELLADSCHLSITESDMLKITVGMWLFQQSSVFLGALIVCLLNSYN